MNTVHPSLVHQLRNLVVLLSLTAGLHAGDAPPGMGWATFNFFLANHNDVLMRRMADAFIANGMRDAGYTILRLDGGWWGDDGQRRWYYWTENGSYAGGATYQDGDPHVDPRNYPQGLRSLADHLHGRGLKLGFYLSPELSIGSAINHPGNTQPARQPTLQGTALIDRHAAFVADAGIDHLFYDGYDWERSVRGEEPYTRMSSSLAAESARVGRRIIFSIHEAKKWRPSAIADEWRTSRDIDAKWSTIRECMSSIIEPQPSGSGRYNNPDYLMAGFPNMTDEEARSQMSIWCVAGVPLYTSYDHRAMTAWDRYVLLNTEAIASNQQVGTSGRRIRASNGLEVWLRVLADGSRVVALLNASEDIADIAVSWSELGLPSGQARVRDLWTHADAGIFSGAYTASRVPAHGCRLVVVKTGTAEIPALAAGFVPDPGAKPVATPVAMAGWSATSSRAGLAKASALFDGDRATSVGDYMYPGTSLDLVLPSPRTLSRVLLDHVGVGPSVWPLTIYAPRTTYTLSASDDGGTTWQQVASGSLGPAYTPIDFPRRSLNRLRLTIVVPEWTSAYHGDPRLSIVDLYAFDDVGTPQSKPGDVNGDGVINAADVTAVRACFGKRSGDPGWNAACDSNADGRVDAVDLDLVTRNQGR